MKKIVQLLLLSVFLYTGAQSQTADFNPTDIVSIEEGPEYKSKNMLNDIVAVKDGHYYAVLKKHNVVQTQFAKNKYFLAKFTIDMSPVTEAELDPQFEGKDLDVEQILMQGDQLIMFNSFLNKAKKKVFLFYQTVDKETLLPNNDLVKVAEIPGDKNKDIKNLGFSILRSEDKSKLLVYYDMPFGEDDNERYGVNLYDQDMKLLWKKEVELPYSDELFVVESKELADNGDVFVMGRLWKDKADREKKEVNYGYKILALTNDGADLNDYDVTLDGRFVSNLYVGLNDQKELILGGFYRNQGTTGADGSFFVKVNRTTKEITQKSFNEFDETFIMEDMRKKEKKKTEKRADKGKEIGISHLKIDEFIRKEDGGAVLVGERQWIERRTRTSNGRTTTYYVYHHHDIILVSIGPDGNIEWNARVPKEQMTTNSNYGSSYLSAIVESSIYFIFNDHPDNMLYAGDGKLKNMSFKENYVAMVEVDSDGRVFRRTLLNEGKGKNLIVMPLSSEQISDRDILLFSQRGKRKQFMTMRFK
ncbi:hypothetical protein O3Q51_00545 [Cryomorphaceae bacterium 1068]|nr:hypothetical protein [Cryomorphaceae bacterium 1068]